MTSVGVAGAVKTDTPLLLQTLTSDDATQLSRPPVWMMRQAGRYMKSYQKLCEKYPSFRERSEIPELAVEISLQPWKAFRPDGVITEVGKVEGEAREGEAARDQEQRRDEERVAHAHGDARASRPSRHILIS